jgi:hypothetical protein
LFVATRNKLPAIRKNSLKYLVRVLIVVYAFLFIYFLSTMRSARFLQGKWRVVQLIRHGDTARVNDWLFDSTSWRNIYLEQFDRITLSANPYVIEKNRSQYGKYEYNGSENTVSIFLNGNYKSDSLKFKLLKLNNNEMIWNGENNDLQLTLLKSE